MNNLHEVSNELKNYMLNNCKPYNEDKFCLIVVEKIKNELSDWFEKRVLTKLSYRTNIGGLYGVFPLGFDENLMVFVYDYYKEEELQFSNLFPFCEVEKVLIKNDFRPIHQKLFNINKDDNELVYNYWINGKIKMKFL